MNKEEKIWTTMTISDPMKIPALDMKKIAIDTRGIDASQTQKKYFYQKQQ